MKYVDCWSLSTRGKWLIAQLQMECSFLKDCEETQSLEPKAPATCCELEPSLRNFAHFNLFKLYEDFEEQSTSELFHVKNYNSTNPKNELTLHPPCASGAIEDDDFVKRFNDSKKSDLPCSVAAVELALR